MKNVGLIEARKQLKLKQEEVAKAIGVSQATISCWERGIYKIDFDAMVSLRKLYKLKNFKIFEVGGEKR